MASREMVAIYCAFLALAATPVTFSAPAQRQTCAPVCTPGRSPSVLKYEEGKSYIYNFETEVITSVVGTTDETNKIKVKGQASVAAQSACDLTLTVQQIDITSSSGQPISRVTDIQGSSIRFAYSDGVIDSVCVSDDDPTWSANIKRAIVSMLGNRALSGDTETIETDVNGKCKTTYEVDGNKYTKTKDIHGCTNRDGGMSNNFGVPYSTPSKYHSIPVFNSILTCTQELGKGVIQSVDCTEGHSLDVIQSSGVRTDIKSSLHLANVQAGIVKGQKEPNKKSCLLYDFGDVSDTQRQKTAASNAIDLLNKICTEIESGSVSLKVPGLFLQLRKQVRFARKDDLKSIDEQVASGKICAKQPKQLRKLLLDAAAMSAGDGAIGYVADVIANGQAEETTKDLFIAYAAFAEHPGVSGLEGLTTLISKPTTEPEFLLAASGFAHQYCRLVNPNCGSNEQYQNLVNTVAQRVNVATDEEAIEKVVVALQALGNVDSLTPQAVSSIVTLLEDSHTNQRLKVRALDAFRRDSCQETLKKKAVKIFSDIQQSSQVRIQAYLTFSRCLTTDDVQVVQNVINNDEESNQVGSFIVSHVSNVLESSNPDKVAQKKVFEQITLREFPTDLRKFSRNFEISAFNPTLMNSGLSLDSNVIFSQDSYIPRCSNSNFTVAAFGRSYNLLELGICVEDFEHIVERLLGPSSKIRSTSLDDIIREGAEKINSIKTNLRNRFKRDVAVTVNENEIDAIRNEVAISERTGDDANGDIYVRILGTSILVESFSKSGMGRNPLIGRLQRAAENLARGVREQNIDITEPFMFMDDEIVAPTSSGFPITVTTEGTSVMSLQIKGNMDVASLLRGENGDMSAKITPSTATVVRARMLLGSGPVESGLALEGKIHSAAGLDLKVVRENKKFELTANLPQERIQLIDVRSDVYWVEQSVDQLEKKTAIKTKSASRSVIDNQCTTSFTKSLGLKLCTDVKAPEVTAAAPLFFLNGPSVLSVSVEKTEASMQGYYVLLEGISNDNTYGFDLVLDTPGSKTNRKISAQGRAVAPASATPQYSLKIEAPENNIQLNYKRSFTDDLVGSEVTVEVNGDHYSGIAEVRRAAEGAGFRLSPLIQYQLPNGNPVKLLEGTITREPGKKLNVDIRSGGPIRILRGSVKGTGVVTQNTDESTVIQLQNLELASDAFGKLQVDGEYKRQNKLYDLKVNSKYGQNDEHTLSLATTVGTPAAGENVLKVSTRSSRREFLNLDLDWSLKRTGNSIVHNLEYTRGVAEPKVSVVQKSTLQIVSKSEFDVNSLITVSHPAYNIDFHAEAVAKSVPGGERNAKLEARLGAGLKAKATYEGNGPLFSNYKMLGNVVFGETTYEISEVATKVDDNKRNFKSRVSVQPGFYYEANTDLFIRMQKGDFKSEVNTVVTSDQLENPITLKSIVKAKPDGYGALLKLDAQGKTYVDLETNHIVTREGGTPSYATKMKAMILNIIDAKLSNTFSNGNGDLVLDALLAKSGRKIAATSHVTRNADTYDLKADLKWDADRDPSRAITLKSTTTLAYAELNIDSKNEITVIADTVKVNFKGGLPREILNGESSAAIDFTAPSGKTYSASTKVELENKPTTRAGKVTLHVAPADVQPSDIEFGVRASNLDQQQRTYDIKADLKASYRKEKDLAVHGELSNSLGNYRSYAGKISASGSAIPKPVDASFKADVKSGRIAFQGESTNPAHSSVDATIDFDIVSPKKSVGVKYAITTPVERVKTLAGEVKGSLMRNSWKNFEVSHQISIALNGAAPHSSTYFVSVADNEGKYSHTIVSSGTQVVSVAAEGKMDPTHLKGSLNSEVRGTVTKLALDVEHQLPDIAITLSGQSNVVESIQSFEVKANNKKQGDGTLDTLVSLSTNDDEKFRASNKLEYTQTRKSIDAALVIGEETPRKLYVLFNEEQAGKYNVEVTCKWGDADKYLTTKGSLHRSDGGFDGELSLDSPALKANKFSVRVAKALDNGEHKVDITIDGNNKRQIAVAATYAARSDASYERHYEGTLKVEGQAVDKPIDFNGKFRLDDTQLDKQRDNGEEGRRVRATVELTAANNPMKLDLLAKRSNKENRLQLSLCKDANGECRVGNIRLRHDHADNGDLDYELRVTAERSVGDANQETNGIVLATTLNKAAKKFEHSGKLIIGSEKDNQVGYRLYRNPEAKEVGAEILLPARVIALVATGDKTSTGAYNGEIAFYIDKTKKADRKISLLLSIGERSSGAAGQGRTVSAILKHPDLNKDMKIKTRYAYGGDATVVEFETILDVLQAGHEIVANYKIDKQVLSNGRIYKSAMSIVSTGLHVNLGSNSEFKYINHELSVENVLSYVNRANEKLTSKLALQVTKERFSFVVDSPSETILSFVSAYVSHPNGGEIRYEVHLPGMEDTRIVRAIANTVSPRNVQLKFSTSSNSAQFVEAFLGFRSNEELSAGVYDHQADGRHVIGDVTLGMNGTRVLSVRSDWSKDNARVVLTRVQQRGQKHLENLRELVTKAANEISQEAQEITKNIKIATPDFSVVSASSRQQLQELKQELEQNEDTKMILQRIQAGSAMMRQFSRVVVELVRSARRIAVAYIGGLREALKNLPEKYSQILDRIPEYIEQLRALAIRGVDAFIDASRVASKVLLEAAERLYESLPPLADIWNWVVDHSEGFIQSLSEVSQKIAEKLVKVYAALQELGKRILTNKALQNLLAELRDKAQALVEEFIQDTKTSLDGFKEYILNAVPQKEFQQFIEALADYIQKKAQKTAVDDEAALKDIYQKLRATVSKAFADVFTFDLSQGIFRAQIPLPVSLKSLSEFTKVFSFSSRPKINFRIPSYTYGLRELINQIRSGAALNEIVPPFKGWALLIGSKHYRTFDGRHFEFEGNCQYLLASDFEDGNFTVVADYDRQGGVSQKSIIVTDRVYQVAIKPDNTVLVNGQEVNLDEPKEAGTLLIERIGNWVAVRSKRGAVLGCSTVADVCAVKVDGFYHGKVLGLLGTMNLEKFDDLRQPNGEITPSVDQFASSWKLDKQCTEPMIISTMIQSTQSAEEKCRAALDSKSSSLRPCYGVVDPTPFRNVCEKLSQKSGYTEEKAVCTAATGYAKACYLSYAKVDSAPACAAA